MSQQTALDYYTQGVAYANEGRYKLAIDAFRKADDLLPREPQRQKDFLASAVGHAIRISIETLQEWIGVDPYNISASDTSELGLILGSLGGTGGMWDDLARKKKQDTLYSVAVLFRGIISVARIRISDSSLARAIQPLLRGHDWTSPAALRPCLALDWSAAFIAIWCNTGYPLPTKILPLPRWIPHHMGHQQNQPFTYRFGVALLSQSEYDKMSLSYFKFYYNPAPLMLDEDSGHVRIESFSETTKLVEQSHWELRTGPGAHPGPTFRITSLVEVGCAPWSLWDGYRLKFAHMQALEEKATIKAYYHG
jgi:tetratricopeptide (TPR) repeat protein